MFASGMLYVVFQNLYPFTIGKLFAAASLGYYTRASSTQEMVSSNLVNVVGRVSFPLFSALQHDVASMKRAVRKALMSIAFVSFPALMGLGCTAVPLVRVLITDRWLPSAGLIPIFCVAGAVTVLDSIHLNALMALGRSDLFFRLEMIKKGLIILAIITTYHYGILGLVWGQACVAVLCYFINAFYSVRLLSYSWREQFVDLLPYLSISGLMGLIVVATNVLLGIKSPAVLLCVQIALGGVAYATGSVLLRVSALVDTWKLVQERMVLS